MILTQQRAKKNQTFQSRFSFPEEIQEEHQVQVTALWNRRERKSERKKRSNIQGKEHVFAFTYPHLNTRRLGDCW